MSSKIKEKLRNGEVVRLFGVGQLFSPKVIEVVGEHGGFDGLWIDVEHVGLSLEQVEWAVLASKAYGLDHFVRLPATDYASIMRPLEVGAGGVMISMVRSVAEAESVVRWAKFWPLGERGLNGGNRDGRFGLQPVAEYIASANDRTFIGIQIETKEALESVDQIAQVSGVDLLFVGPADISQVFGIPGQYDDPRCYEAIDRIALACERAGKPWGIVPKGAAYAERMRDRGCRMFVLGFDIHALNAGVLDVKARYPSFFGAN